jgi:HEAT repeat protein
VLSHERAGDSVPAMLDRLAAEDDLAVRASLILALGELASRARPHPAAVPAALTPLLDAPEPDERAAAAVALRWQRDWAAQPDNVLPVLFDALGRDLPVLDDLPVVDRDIFEYVSAAVGTDLDETLPHLTQALRSGSWQTRHAAISQGGVLMQTWRSASPALVPVLLPMLADRTARVRVRAAEVLSRDSGRSLALVTDALAEALADVSTRVDLDRMTAGSARRVEEPDTWLAAAAVEGLAAAGDARAVEPAVRSLRSNALILHWGVALQGLRQHATAVLPAVRDVLRAGADRTWLFDGVAAWGDAAAPVVPELLALVRNGSEQAMRTLLAVTTPERPYAGEVVAALTERLVPGAPESWLAFAADHYRLTGDPAPALAVLLPELREDGPLRVRGGPARPARPDAEPALPWVRRLLGDTHAEHRYHGAIAWWRITGDVQTLLPFVTANLEGYRFPAEHLTLLAEIGPPARDALPLVREVRDGDRRYAMGGYLSAVQQDETLRALAATAVQQIGAG